MKKWFSSREFQEKYHYDGPLGAFCNQEGTQIFLWAPTAQTVFLHLYIAGNDCDPVETVAMEQRQKGVWRYRSVRNLDGWYYDFDVTVDGKTLKTGDPYAKACGVNGQRSMIIALEKTDPVGWAEDVAPAATPEQVIYELHIKDFSWDPAGGFDLADRGKFSALCRRGTTLWGEGVYPTGLDYLKRLGVTHIQLMPIYDYGSVDERNWESGYNWGYDPMNYNVPEGSYSSDPYHGHVRVRELKEAVAALHREGFRVIMDVVYNHTYANDSWLWRTVPGYFYRQKSDGTPSNGSGCGNDIASERSMCARYILDSVLYWVEQYHMDGFRFDLMGLLDQPLMESIQYELDKRYGTGQKMIYGEPWRGGNTHLSKPVTLCDKNSLKTINGRIGAFCDDTRDAVKGGLMDRESKGFVNGGEMNPDHLRCCLSGWAGKYGVFQTPAQTITYLSCHDDWTLWDKLIYTMDEKKRFAGYQEEVLQVNRLAAAINFCCQGRPFFLAGEEFARTKGGIKNSYCSDSQINQLDWTRAQKNCALVDYYRGLIALRMQLPALQDKTATAAERILWMRKLAKDCIMTCVDNRGGEWKELLLIFNCGERSGKAALPPGTWQVLVDGQSSFRWQEDIVQASTLTISGKTALIMGLK